MYDHIVQSPQWQEFKEKYGTPTVRAGNIFYTKHQIPHTGYFYAYCPRVNPFEIDFEQLKSSLAKNNCIAINFDVPNVIVGDPKEEEASKIFEKTCKKAFRSEFAKANVLLDLTLSEEDLLRNMHPKHRYNINYAQKKGVVVRQANSQADFDAFYKLHAETAKRQKYFARQKNYYKLVWDMLRPKSMCEILIAEYEGTPLAAWMLFVYKNVLYYPYGGSLLEHKNLFASNLLGWEVIRFGKNAGCTLFDMWGAALDQLNERDSYFGFTNFKLKFGGKHVKYIDSYDFVIKPLVYYLFNLANYLRWQLLEGGILK